MKIVLRRLHYTSWFRTSADGSTHLQMGRYRAHLQMGNIRKWDPTDTFIVTSPLLCRRDDLSIILLQVFELVHEDAVTSAATGLNYYTSSLGLVVNKGDMLAVQQLTGRLYRHPVTSSCYELGLTSSHVAGQALTLTSAMACIDGQHQFSAHMIKVRIQRYTLPDIHYPQRLHVAGDLSNTVCSRSV